MSALFDGMEVVDPAALVERISRDPDDDVVIATALAGACDTVITGDNDLLVLASHVGIRFLSPRVFWEIDGPSPP